MENIPANVPEISASTGGERRALTGLTTVQMATRRFFAAKVPQEAHVLVEGDPLPLVALTIPCRQNKPC